MPACRLDHVASRGAGEIRVVEDDPPHACRQRLVQCVGELTQRSSVLVAIETAIATGNVLLGNTALSGSGNAHDDDHVSVVGWAGSRGASRTRRAECPGEDRSLVVVEAELGS